MYSIVTYYLIKIIATSIFTFDNRGYVVRNRGRCFRKTTPHLYVLIIVYASRDEGMHGSFRF